MKGKFKKFKVKPKNTRKRKSTSIRRRKPARKTATIKKLIKTVLYNRKKLPKGWKKL